MVRLAYPLVLLAALAAGRAHAQDGDRYGPRPAAYASAPTGGVRLGSVPALRPAAPTLRTLSWPGKAELRPALAPAVGAGAPTSTTPATYAFRSAPAPTGRFPSMAAYGVAPPTPALRPAAAPYAEAPSTSRPPPARPVRRRPSAAAGASAVAAQPVQLAPSFAAQTSDRRAGPRGGSNLPSGLAAPPAYVPAGPAYGPALAAEARDQARAAGASTTDTLPPPTIGRYGYVGPGRTAADPSPDQPYPAAASPAPGSSASLGPPRPPAYARGYVLPARQATSGSPAAAVAGANGETAPRTPDGVRRYSVHREYGMEPDPLPVPPQFFAATPDLSTPETDPAAPRNSKAAVNAARLAASGN